jgi:alpha-L-rhamnosidase
MSQPQSTTITNLRIEQLRPADTLGCGFTQPRLSWQIVTAGQSWRQAAYEIEQQTPDGAAHTSGRVASDQSVLVAWPFAPLGSRTQSAVRVRVWGEDGCASEWSEPLAIELGLLHTTDWSARFITPDWDEDTTVANPAPYLRREFVVTAPVKCARLYISALGVYAAELNGARVGDHVLAPGWTVYDARLRYQTFDVTHLIQEGPNAIGALLGDGWFRGRLGFGGGRRNIWGDRLALLAQLEITYNDGSTEHIVSDETWRAATGPLLLNSLYDGETYDARLELAGWSAPGFDDSGWQRVRPLAWNLDTLVAPVGPPVRRTAEHPPVAITQSPAGKTLIDFGQNLVGRVRITASGPAGQVITLRHAEVLEHGELGTRPLRLAAATDRYTLKGTGAEVWEPVFTFHGFRYVELDGWPGELRPADIVAVVLHSDMVRSGWFECSNPLLNRLHENVVWGMRGNFLDVPTDCPQRDERLGWTGDLQVFAPTACFLYDASGFLRSWLADLAADQQKAGGIVPIVVPNALGEPMAAAAWGDAATVVPSVLYARYGDSAILADQFASMKAWVDTVAAFAGPRRLWDRGFQFGDWLDPSAPPDKPGQARADKRIVATAYFARSAELVSRAAAVLGYDEDAAAYGALAAEIRAAFVREYVTPAGRLMSDAETAYALALEFDLLPTAEQRHAAGARLAKLLMEGGYCIRTGFVGTPLICDALAHAGRVDAAYRLLLQTDCPSWLYPVTMGATTVWERWDSMLPDGSINPGEMTSFNHYALGAVADWLHRSVGGLAPLTPGYRSLEIRPQPGGGLTSARARHLTPYGPAECGWQIADGELCVDVIVPPNTTAQVTLPGAPTPLAVGSGVWQWRVPYTAAVRQGYTLDDPIGDIMADKPARAAVMAALAAAQAPGFVFAVLDNERTLPLRAALGLVGDAERLGDAVAAALAALAH